MLAPNSPTIERLRPPTTIDADGTVEGYASLFGEIDQARDMVVRGAFAATLATRGMHRIPMLFQHDPAEPVGVWLELIEDWRGLKARGKLIPDVQRGRELLALLQGGAIDGLSIGYRTVRGVIDPKSRVRKLYQVDLWEISIVTFPLLNGARVAAVKAPPASPQRRAARVADPGRSGASRLRHRRLLARGCRRSEGGLGRLRRSTISVCGDDVAGRCGDGTWPHRPGVRSDRRVTTVLRSAGTARRQRCFRVHGCPRTQGPDPDRCGSPDA